MMKTLTLIFLGAVLGGTGASAEELFDGRSLKGWRIIGAPESAWSAKDGWCSSMSPRIGA